MRRSVFSQKKRFRHFEVGACLLLMFSHMKDRAPGGCRAWKAGRLMDARHVRGIRRDVMVREGAACHSTGHADPYA